MSERAEKMGGAFSMVSTPGQGTEIIVEFADKEDAASYRRRTGRNETVCPPPDT